MFTPLSSAGVNGTPAEDNFRYESCDYPSDPPPGHVLIENLYLSVDPAQVMLMYATCACRPCDPRLTVRAIFFLVICCRFSPFNAHIRKLMDWLNKEVSIIKISNLSKHF